PKMNLGDQEGRSSELLRHLGSARRKTLCNPIGTRQTTRGKKLQLLLYVILHSSDRWICPIQQKVGGTVIAIRRKTNAAGVDDKPFSNLWAGNAPNIGAMNMPVHGNRLAQRSENR